ncbi:MAG: hypothetical protein RLY71_1161 [Pseudomonadota bacterium]|jgi:hypothetical protein
MVNPSDLNDARMVALTEGLVNGLSAKPELFPDCPVDLGALAGAMNGFKALLAGDADYERHMAALREEQHQAMEKLVWSARALAEFLNQLHAHGLIPPELGPPPTDLPPVKLVPGPCHQLCAREHGPEQVELVWRVPISGSRVLGYEVQKAQVPCGPGIPWETAITSLSNRVVLPQPDGSVFLYRVVGRGPEGLGEPSTYVAIRMGPDPEEEPDDEPDQPGSGAAG